MPPRTRRGSDACRAGTTRRGIRRPLAVLQLLQADRALFVSGLLHLEDPAEWPEAVDRPAVVIPVCLPVDAHDHDAGREGDLAGGKLLPKFRGAEHVGPHTG
eukprot:CAMPEP_0204157342 /NCGR_PEP_ID=MMETSP0361-20130328/31167_1 /ASSEMBLY_ACC=CAM_ASM_000343 /TAXON_ID=268821 /ORGANISM="Scrippsiella Hangoei, Strain SHTV-5" /LENGTH=101 /DNA_ID=CAMNT_0051113111 /DNA_START=205 /DNA_END=510 /DNA_ORIENTATION=-